MVARMQDRQRAGGRRSQVTPFHDGGGSRPKPALGNCPGAGNVGLSLAGSSELRSLSLLNVGWGKLPSSAEPVRLGKTEPSVGELTGTDASAKQSSVHCDVEGGIGNPMVVDMVRVLCRQPGARGGDVALADATTVGRTAVIPRSEASTGLRRISQEDTINCTQGVRGNASIQFDGLDKGDELTASVSMARRNTANAWTRPPVIALPSRSELGEFIVGDIVQLDKEAVLANIARLEAALVGRMFGKKIPFFHLSNELKRRWERFGHLRLVTVAADCFVCFFNDSSTLDTVLMGGPWIIDGQVLGLDKWSPSFSPSSVVGFITPVWVRLPGLPLYCWDALSLARITALIGEPLWLDAATDKMERGTFARVRVKIDLSKPMKPGVWIEGHHGRFFQPIEYEGLSLFCFRCGHVGHRENSCKSLIIQDKQRVTKAAQDKERSNLPAVNKTRATPLTQRAGPQVFNEAASMEDDGDRRACSFEEQSNDCLGANSHMKMPWSGCATATPPGLGPWMLVARKKRPPKANRDGTSPTYNSGNPPPPLAAGEEPLAGSSKALLQPLSKKAEMLSCREVDMHTSLCQKPSVEEPSTLASPKTTPLNEPNNN